ncbi:MAG: hypothetical protein QM533_11055 [Cytophagales bacterium]|nr:hypothetical protein [Cytophagales bacterium]
MKNDLERERKLLIGQWTGQAGRPSLAWLAGQHAREASNDATWRAAA